MGRKPTNEVEGAGLVQTNGGISIIGSSYGICSIAAVVIRLCDLQHVVKSFTVVEVESVADNKLLC